MQGLKIPKPDEEKDLSSNKGSLRKVCVQSQWAYVWEVEIQTIFFSVKVRYISFMIHPIYSIEN